MVKFSLFIVLIFLFFGAVFVFSPNAGAVSFGVNSGFGGRIFSIVPLTVPPCVGSLLFVGGPVPTVLFFPSGALYSYKAPLPNNWLLGLGTNVNVCGGFLYLGMGTSLTP